MCISTGNFDSIFFLGFTHFLNNRISWNFVIMKDIMCRCANPQEILIPFFFSDLRPFWNFEIWRKWNILLKHLVSTTQLKPLNRIAWNFVVMKDIMCKYAFLQEMLIWSFWGEIYIPFFLWLPVINAWNCHSYSILKQCWSVGYVSLLTLSFLNEFCLLVDCWISW